MLNYLHENRKGDLSDYWPDRVVPIPGVALASVAPMQATQQLQALLRDKNRPSGFPKLPGLLGRLLDSCSRMAQLLVYQKEQPDAERLFPISEQLFSNIPKQSSAKQQYEWALVETDPKFSSRNGNRLNTTSAKLLARLISFMLALVTCNWRELTKKVGDDTSAVKLLTEITKDSQWPILLQALAWLEISAIEHTRENKGQVKIAVEMALQLRESLSDTDKEQLDLTVKNLPSDIELYWAPSPAS